MFRSFLALIRVREGRFPGIAASIPHTNPNPANAYTMTFVVRIGVNRHLSIASPPPPRLCESLCFSHHIHLFVSVLQRIGIPEGSFASGTSTMRGLDMI